MPEFAYRGAYGRAYTESKDALGGNVGLVEPGDTRDLNEPLDGDWYPVPPPEPAPALKARTSGKTAPTEKAGVTGEEG